jgi:hypothetical protein
MKIGRAREPRPGVKQTQQPNANNSPRVSAQVSHRNPNPEPRLAVYDGARRCGHIVPRDGKFAAFDQNDNLVGTFASQTAAVRSLPDGGEP